jgi:hypothetical protein
VGEVHTDMSKSALDCGATRMDLTRSAHQSDKSRTGDHPNGLQSLTGGDQCDSPSD